MTLSDFIEGYINKLFFLYCRVNFHLSGKAVALCLDNSTSKASLCSQSGTLSLFSILACYVLNLADKHGITLIPAYILTYSCGS